MKRFVLTAILLPVALYNLRAQADSSKVGRKKVFSSQIAAGITEGESSSSFQLQTINGLKIGTWFTGVGVGLDYYLYRSIPFFLSATKYLSPGNHSFFLQGDGGMNFGWVSSKIDRFNNVISDKFKPGLYWNAAIGFSTAFGNQKNALLFSLGYSYKHLKEIKEMQVFCINPPCPPQVENYNYHLRRLSLRIGWQFNAIH